MFSSRRPNLKSSGLVSARRRNTAAPLHPHPPSPVHAGSNRAYGRRSRRSRTWDIGLWYENILAVENRTDSNEDHRMMIISSISSYLRRCQRRGSGSSIIMACPGGSSRCVSTPSLLLLAPRSTARLESSLCCTLTRATWLSRDVPCRQGRHLSNSCDPVSTTVP